MKDTTGAGWATNRWSSPDLYFLRGLLVCRTHSDLAIATATPDGQRRYTCPRDGHGCREIPAEVVEQLVWQQFATRHTTTAHHTSRARRHHAVAAELARVTVGHAPTDLEYQWRP